MVENSSKKQIIFLRTCVFCKNSTTKGVSMRLVKYILTCIYKIYFSWLENSSKKTKKIFEEYTLTCKKFLKKLWSYIIFLWILNN